MTDADRIEACRRALAATCRERNVFITGDGRVGAKVAAELLGLAEETIANDRSSGTSGLPYYQLAAGGSRVSYSLTDLAAFIVARRVHH